jgi:hypothetical protein
MAFMEIEDLCVTADTNGGNAVSDRFLETLTDQEILPRLRKLNLRGFYALTLEAADRLRLARPHLSLQWAELQAH